MQLFEDTLPEIVAAALHSPMFYLSLSDKGAFHTNVMAWLVREYPEAMVKWLRKQLRISVKNIVKVQHEPNGFPFPLVLFMDNEQERKVIVIENHMSYTPGAEYLPELTKKAREYYGTRAQVLLLCVSDLFFVVQRDTYALSDDLNICCYEEIAEMLKTLPTRSKSHAAVLDDYSFTLKQYCRIHDAATNLSFDAPFIGTFREWEDALRKMGLMDYGVFYTFIHAVYSRCEALLQEICKRLEIPLALTLYTQATTALSSNNHLYFLEKSDGKPRIKIAVTTHEGNDNGSRISLGVQIKGNEFRLYAAISADQTDLKDFATVLHGKNFWLTFRDTPEPQKVSQLWDKNLVLQDFELHQVFGSNSARILVSDVYDSTSAEDIINAMVSYIQHSRKNVEARDF